MNEKVNIPKDIVDSLNGSKLTNDEVLNLENELLPMKLPEWIKDLFLNYPIVSVNFEYPADKDDSGFGVFMRWNDSSTIISELKELYPGISLQGLNYLPIGNCLLGSGDPYFLKLNNIVDSEIVRVRHDLAIEGQLYDITKVEIVCTNLDLFFQYASVL